jgi:hypothetical protein
MIPSGQTEGALLSWNPRAEPTQLHTVRLSLA